MHLRRYHDAQTADAEASGSCSIRHHRLRASQHKRHKTPSNRLQKAWPFSPCQVEREFPALEGIPRRARPGTPIYQLNGSHQFAFFLSDLDPASLTNKAVAAAGLRVLTTSIADAFRWSSS